MKEVFQTICIDYLELCFKGTLPDYKINPETFQINGNCFIEYLHVNNEHFGTVCNLYIDNRKIGELKYNPKMTYIKEETIHFKFENHLLYTKDLNFYFNYIIDIIGLKYEYITRIDIANDLTKHNIVNFIRKYENITSIECKGKPKTLNTKKIGKECKIIYFGSLRSDKSIKIYNKTEELKLNEKKYIEEFWKINGLDYHNNNVERLELVLRGKQCKTINLFAVQNSNYLASICRTHFKNYFDFTEKYFSHGKIYYKDCTPINFDLFETNYLEKFKYVPKYSVKPIKIQIKRLFIDSLIEQEIINQNNPTSDIQEQVNNPLNNICFHTQINISNVMGRLKELYNLNDYFKKNKPFWEHEFSKNKTIYINRINYEKDCQN